MSFDSLSSFFYNLVPGGLFIFSIYSFRIIPVSAYESFKFLDTNGLSLGLFIVVSLFFGFVFQACTKSFRMLIDPILLLILEKSNKDEFKNALKAVKLKKEKLSNPKYFLYGYKKPFYLLDNKYREHNFLIGHFSTRLAFWSNIFFAIILFRLIEIYFHTYIKFATFDLLIFPYLFIFSFLMYLWHQFGYYDSILKTYVLFNKLSDLKPSVKKNEVKSKSRNLMLGY